MRQVIIILIAAGLIGYDLLALNGHYLKLVVGEAGSIWNSIQTFFWSFF